MDNGWKSFFKENILLFLLLFVVVFGLLGYKVYQFAHEKRNENIIYGEHEPTVLPDVIRSYEANEYKVIEKDDQDLAEYYLNKIIKIWMKNPGDLYDYLTEKTKNSFKTKEEFIKKLDHMKSSFTQSSIVDKYLVENSSVTIQTNEGIQIKVISHGINDFEISYIGKN